MEFEEFKKGIAIKSTALDKKSNEVDSLRFEREELLKKLTNKVISKYSFLKTVSLDYEDSVTFEMRDNSLVLYIFIHADWKLEGDDLKLFQEFLTNFSPSLFKVVTSDAFKHMVFKWDLKESE